MAWHSIWLLALSACMGDFRPDRLKLEPYSPEFSVPLAYGTVTMADLVADRVNKDEFYVNKEGIYEFAYTGTLQSKRLDEVLGIGPAAMPGFSLDPTRADANGGYDLTMQYPTQAGEALSYIVTKANLPSRLTLDIDNRSNADMELSLTFTSINRVGSTTPTSGSITLGAGRTGTLNVDLTNSQIRLNNSNRGLQRFGLRLNRRYLGGQATNGNIEITPRMDALQFHYLEGHLGSFNWMAPTMQSVDIKLFNHSLGSDGDGVQFEDPKVYVNLTSGIDYPAEVYLNNIYTTKPGSNRQYPLHLPDGVTPFTKTVPLLAAIRTATAPYVTPSAVTLRTTRDSVTKANSDAGRAFAFFGTLPDKLWYEASIRGDRNYDNNLNFYGWDSSRVRASMTALLPCDGRVYRYTAVDTLTLDLPDPSTQGTGQLEFAELAARHVNGFPCTAWGQLYFMDENYQVFDSLIQAAPNSPLRKIVEAAPVSDAPLYKVTNSVRGPVQRYRITADKYKLWQRRARYILYVVRMSGVEGGPDPNDFRAAGFTTPRRRTRIYPDYQLTTQLGISFKFKPLL